MFSKEQLLAEKARRQQAKSSSQFTREELLAEKARRSEQKQMTPAQQQTESGGDVDFNAMTAVKNIPSSGAQFVSDMVAPFLNPGETLESMQNLASGVAQKFAAGDSEHAVYADESNVQLADAVGQAITDRYGGSNQLKQTAMEDPVGLLSDVVGLVSGGSALVPKYGSKIQKIANAADPANMVLNTAKAAGKLVPENLPNDLYKRSAKFSTKLDDVERTEITQTALDEKISPTSEGLEKLDAILTEESTKVRALLDEAESAGKNVNKTKLLVNLRKEINQMDKLSTPDYAKRKAQMVGVLDDFGRQWKGTKDLTPNQVQDLKLGLDEVINWNRRQQSGKFAVENAQKTMRRGAKESLEEISPGIGEANERMSKLKALKEGGLEASANRIANNNLIGIQTPIAAVVGGQVGNMVGSPEIGAVMGAAASKATSGTLQADIAIALNAIKQSPLRDIYFDGNGQLTEVGRQALIQMGRLNDISNEQGQQPPQ